jgi:hypothetical protein
MAYKKKEGKVKEEKRGEKKTKWNRMYSPASKHNKLIINIS